MNTITNRLPDTKHETLQLIQVAFENATGGRMPYNTYKAYEAMTAQQLVEVYRLIMLTQIKANRSCINKLERIKNNLI